LLFIFTILDFLVGYFCVGFLGKILGCSGRKMGERKIKIAKKIAFFAPNNQIFKESEVDDTACT